MQRPVRKIALAVLACAALLLAPFRASAEDSGAALLSAGIAARGEHPPNLTVARADFEEAARGTDDRSAAEALYLLGEINYAALDFKSALAHYEASARRLPSNRHTPRALSLVAELRNHAEGDFAPLARLETVRRSTALSSDPAAVDALVHDANAFPPGRVRVEARMLAAEAYAGRLGRKSDARELFRQVADDPNADPLTGREAATELFNMYVQDRQYDSALATARTYPKLLPQHAERDVRRLVRRGFFRVLAWGDLAVLVAFALYALALPGRSRALGRAGRLLPMALLFSMLATVVGGALASRYEQTNPFPFGAMFPVIFAVILLGRVGSAGGSAKSSARAIRGLVAFAAVFGVAFLMLDRMDPVYLQGFGL